ncbi:TPA: hypothetical protein UM365_001294 [Stenotrophomonas maltophilia]|uniref:hypothetical protein n=1 Tax=Stenotrophomonas maltophilia TaxID=40324 RepID=UPI000C2676FE|nr:hypothetical protein [Stenotrophomonas maltophilia]EKT4099094.1 hypothetical protein [Stenotrophomonas maltophilia]PJL45221.1 hypothetical protein B9Y78_02180 [Stenotrophomonas maltophilia]REC84955.1 hypothetical protein DXT57_13205 [Stenotrophomonas maltophilia]UGB09422.1 hypothetical protein LQ331_00675 [Stenotrophomonas maltophilia]HEL3219838.1 hypothetical protein [Stenotrophomonas maltophilia]
MRRMACLIPALMLAACSQPAAPPAEPAADAPPPMEAGAPATPAASATEPAASAPAAPVAEAPAEDARARIETLLGDAAQFEKVFNAFKAAVVGGDRAAVVEEVRFPLNVGGGKKITGPGEFQRNYEKIITPAVVKAVSEQDFGKVFVNQQGVMIGSGQVWLNGQCLDQACTKTEVKVITIQ